MQLGCDLDPAYLQWKHAGASEGEQRRRKYLPQTNFWPHLKQKRIFKMLEISIPKVLIIKILTEFAEKTFRKKNQNFDCFTQIER